MVKTKFLKIILYEKTPTPHRFKYFLSSILRVFCVYSDVKFAFFPFFLIPILKEKYSEREKSNGRLACADIFSDL